MSRFSLEQIAAIRAESERLLADKPPAEQPAPTPVREVPLVFEDDMDKWRREAAESDERRAKAKAELQREAREAHEARSAVGRIAALEDRIAQLEWALADANATTNELAKGAQALGDAVTQATFRMETKLAELSGKLVELRAADDLRRGGVIDMPSPLRPRSVN